MVDRVSELDELTLRIVALIEDTTVAGQRRIALAAYARQARQDPAVAEIVRLTLAFRRRRRRHGRGGKVIRLGARR